MNSTSPPNDGMYEVSLRQGQLKHAVKTALACCLAAGVAYRLRTPAGPLATVFVYLLLTLGMPRPRLNWLLTQLAIASSAVVSALILAACRDAPFLYLAVTLLWIFTCMLLGNWFPLPATLGAMVSALGIFVFFQGTVGAALTFYVGYGVNFAIAGFAVVVVQTLLWPSNRQEMFLRGWPQSTPSWKAIAGRRPGGFDRASRRPTMSTWRPKLSPTWNGPLSGRCTACWRRSCARPLPASECPLQSVCSHDPRLPIANLRLWFFNRVIAPVAPAALSVEVRQQLAGLLDRCAAQFHALLEGALQRKPVLPVDSSLIQEVGSARWDAGRTGGAAGPASPTGERVEGWADILLARGIHASVLHRLAHDIEIATVSHNALFASFDKGLVGELAALRPTATSARLVDAQSLRSGAKLVVIVLLLLLEEGWLGFPGGSQVAFYATFFASTGNLGRQNKTDLVGLAGLLAGFLYGVVAAFFTSRLPHFPLLLLLVFLGEFLASLAFQKLPRFGVAGIQAGLAIPFAYLATTGPEWGSFSDVRTRFWGLVVAGFTAVVVHAYLWPVLPMRQLRASIAAALRATAVSLDQLFAAPRTSWKGPPPSLGDTVTRARDLLDDARYLPGTEHADPAYNGVLGCLQEIDANLEFVHFLVGLEEEHPLRQRFFQVIGDYAEQATSNLERVAQQFQPSPSRAARLEPVHWRPDASGRWESAPHDVGQVLNEPLDRWRPAVIARCLDQIARAVQTVSGIVQRINLRNQ